MKLFANNTETENTEKNIFNEEAQREWNQMIIILTDSGRNNNGGILS